MFGEPKYFQTKCWSKPTHIYTSTIGEQLKKLK